MLKSSRFLLVDVWLRKHLCACDTEIALVCLIGFRYFCRVSSTSLASAFFCVFLSYVLCQSMEYGFCHAFTMEDSIQGWVPVRCMIPRRMVALLFILLRTGIWELRAMDRLQVLSCFQRIPHCCRVGLSKVRRFECTITP